MDDSRVRSRIHHLISSHEGIKSQNLIATLSTEYMAMTNEELKHILLDMISSGEFIEIEYHIAGSKSRSFFVPKETRIEISK